MKILNGQSPFLMLLSIIKVLNYHPNIIMKFIFQMWVVKDIPI